MKKLIKKILKSRVDRDEDFKNSNIVLSKRSYKHFDFLINKLFKKFLLFSIFTNQIRCTKNLFKCQIIDQQDLIYIISIFVPGKLFDYAMFSTIGLCDENDEKKDDQIISSLFIKNKIIQQHFNGQYEYTQCFIKTFRLFINFIVNELVDCCLHHIYSINRRKNIIDLVDLLNTIENDDDFRILFKKLTNGDFKEDDTLPSLYVYWKSFMYISRNTKNDVYDHFNKNKSSYQGNRPNKPVSIYSTIKKDENGLHITKKKVLLVHVLKNKQKTKLSIVKTITGTKFKPNQPNYKRGKYIPSIGLVKSKRTMEHITSLDMYELKKNLKNLGLKVSGTKSDLVQRIFQHYEEESKSNLRKLSKKITFCVKKVTKKGDESFYPVFEDIGVEVYIDTYKVVDPTDPNSIYFEFEDFTGITGKPDDEIVTQEDGDVDDNSFTHGEYTDDEDDVASEIDGGNELDIYSFDFNKFYKDQLKLSKKSNPTLYSRLLKKSPRWLWKNKEKLYDRIKIEQYQLPPLPESDVETDEEVDSYDDEELENDDQENEKDEKENDDYDEEEDEDEEDDISSSELYDYEACYEDLMGTDGGHDITDARLSPYSFFKKRSKYGFDDPDMWEPYKYSNM